MRTASMRGFGGHPKQGRGLPALHAAYIGTLELDRREVDRHGSVAWPMSAFYAGLVQDLLANLDDQSRVFGERNELGGRNHSPLMMRPSQQRLTSDNSLSL